MNGSGYNRSADNHGEHEAIAAFNLSVRCRADANVLDSCSDVEEESLSFSNPGIHDLGGFDR